MASDRGLVMIMTLELKTLTLLVSASLQMVLGRYNSWWKCVNEADGKICRSLWWSSWQWGVSFYLGPHQGLAGSEVHSWQFKSWLAVILSTDKDGLT